MDKNLLIEKKERKIDIVFVKDFENGRG